VLRLLPAPIHAIALTQRGHGAASKPEAGYRVRDFASDVVAVLDALALDDAVIVGHSMGSAVAQRFAMDQPARTRGLVLAGACLIEPGGPRVQAFWDSTVSELSDPVDPEFVRGFIESTFASSVLATAVEREVADALKLPARVWQAAWRSRLAAEDASDELDAIAAPTLIVWGDRDQRCPRRHQDALMAGIRDARLVVYEGVGHSPHVEAPERFAADLATFVLNRDESRSG
jgi:pimeloyl-ACP methyl ester carboxylesterase